MRLTTTGTLVAVAAAVLAAQATLFVLGISWWPTVLAAIVILLSMVAFARIVSR